MIRKINILKGLLMAIVFMALSSCSDSDDSASRNSDKDANLFLSITTKALNAAAATDGLALGGDSQFTSLAIYIFNESDGTCEYAELIPGTVAISELYRSVEVSSQTKIVYAVANYNGSDKVLSLPLTPTTTIQQLEELTVTNNADLTDESIMMIGKQRIEINSTYVQAEIPMERLVARVDIYMFKNYALANDSVQVVLVELLNQVINTNCAYMDNTMMPSPKKRIASYIYYPFHSLKNIPSDINSLVPQNANMSFYSYQNIVERGAVPDSSQLTPYLRITVNINGTNYIYGAYITDAGQTENKYSLRRNIVYRVIAMLDHPDNLLQLQVTPLPWNVSESQTGGTVTEADYSFDASGGNDTGATTGIVHFPYVFNSVPYDETSYANYSFSLTGPPGKIWTATLTNGLDFAFGSQATSSGGVSVSHGIARGTPYQISVGASKSWGGTERKTYMYITVDGTKLRINPLRGDNTRKFPGTNDTDILINQTQYK